MRIEPCATTDITTSADQEYTYLVRDNGFTTSAYSLTQVPACGNAETIELSPDPLPSFLTHDPTTKTFTLSRITDYNFVGTYEVFVKMISTFRDDPENAISFATFENEVKFTFIIDAICPLYGITTSTVFPDPLTYQLGEN